MKKSKKLSRRNNFKLKALSNKIKSGCIDRKKNTMIKKFKKKRNIDRK